MSVCLMCITLSYKTKKKKKKKKLKLAKFVKRPILQFAYNVHQKC